MLQFKVESQGTGNPGGTRWVVVPPEGKQSCGALQL